MTRRLGWVLWAALAACSQKSAPTAGGAGKPKWSRSSFGWSSVQPATSATAPNKAARQIPAA